MNEATAALYGSIATAVLGFLGIWITQRVTLKVARIKAKEEEGSIQRSIQPELPFELVPGTGMTGLAMVRLDIEQLKVTVLAEQRNLLYAVHQVRKDVTDLRDEVASGGMPPVL